MLILNTLTTPVDTQKYFAFIALIIALFLGYSKIVRRPKTRLQQLCNSSFLKILSLIVISYF